jgi:hypothetical protein
VIHLKKLNQAGFDHVIMVAVFVFLFGVAGTFYLIQEHAATTTYVELHIGSTSGSCVNGATTAGCNGTDSTDEYATMSGSNFAIKSKSGACLDDWNGGVGSNAATRTYIHSTTCYGDKNQEWNWSNHRLVNVASQGCINGLGGSTGSGTQLIVYTCNSQNDEEFFETSLSSGGSSNGGGGTEGSLATEICEDDSSHILSINCPNVGVAINIVAKDYPAWNDSTQLLALGALWAQESGFDVTAENASGAYGIPQALPGSKMASAGPNWETSATTQIDWGLGYIKSVYGSPYEAELHEQTYGWYAVDAGVGGAPAKHS